MKNTSTLFYDQKLKLWCKPCVVCKNGLVKQKYESRAKRDKTCSEKCKTKLKQSNARLPSSKCFKSEDLMGDKNPRWTGDNVSYGGVHDYISLHLGKPKNCEKCGTDDSSKRYEWANISGEYKRDFEDWIRLCRQCHYSFDGYALFQYQKRKVREKMSNNKSGFKNVCQEKRSGRYYSYIATKGYRQRLGTFDTPEEAYEVYKEKALELFGRY